MTKKERRPQNENDLKYEDELNEDALKNEDILKNCPPTQQQFCPHPPNRNRIPHDEYNVCGIAHAHTY